MSIFKAQSNRISPATVLLGFLYREASHGYELHQRLQAEFGDIWHVSQSQTYNIVKRLENQGYINSTELAQKKLPPRQCLHLTEQGRTWFDTWLQTPTKCSVHAIRVEFITRLYFINLYYPSETIRMIEQQIEEVRSGVDRLINERRGFPQVQRFNRLALDLRIELLTSILNWLRVCRQEYGRDH